MIYIVSVCLESVLVRGVVHVLVLVLVLQVHEELVYLQLDLLQLDVVVLVLDLLVVLELIDTRHLVDTRHLDDLVDVGPRHLGVDHVAHYKNDVDATGVVVEVGHVKC